MIVVWFINFGSIQIRRFYAQCNTAGAILIVDQVLLSFPKFGADLHSWANA